MRFYLKLACISWCKKSVIMQPCFIFDVNAMGVLSEISLPTNKPDIRQNLWEKVRWSQIRLDQPLEQEGRKEIRLDQPSWGRLGWDSMLFYWIYHSITLNPIQDWSSLICFLPFFCSRTMNGDLLNLRPPPPHLPLIQSNEFMPIILERKGLRRTFLVDFKFLGGTQTPFQYLKQNPYRCPESPSTDILNANLKNHRDWNHKSFDQIESIQALLVTSERCTEPE